MAHLCCCLTRCACCAVAGTLLTRCACCAGGTAAVRQAVELPLRLVISPRNWLLVILRAGPAADWFVPCCRSSTVPAATF